MVMPFEAAWEKLVQARVDPAADIVAITKSDIESVTGNELRLMAKMDSSADLPEALRRHGYFILPIKNGEYLLVRGEGFHRLEQTNAATVFRPQLDFELTTLGVGDSESQHLDYCFHVGLIEHFAKLTGLRQTIRGRKRMQAIDFYVGSIGPIHVDSGVQVEVDLGCEGREDVILIEAKTGQPRDFNIRQLYYPYRMWREEIPNKHIRPWFFSTTIADGQRRYCFWEYRFSDDRQYLSLELVRSETFVVQPEKNRLTVAQLLAIHTAGAPPATRWNVPQADSFWRVAELPLLLAQGIDTAAKVAAHYQFDPRQSSYYRQAAEFLGLIRSGARSHCYELTDLGQAYVALPADERRELLAGILAQFPPMRAVLGAIQQSTREITKDEIVELIARNSTIASSTPRRRASTILAWLRWLESATGAVGTTQLGFHLLE